MDMGLEDDGRSNFVLGGVGESRAGPARCCWEEDESTSSLTGGAGEFEGEEAEVGERGGPPKVDIKDNTTITQGFSKRDNCSTRRCIPLEERPILIKLSLMYK